MCRRENYNRKPNKKMGRDSLKKMDQTDQKQWVKSSKRNTHYVWFLFAGSPMSVFDILKHAPQSLTYALSLLPKRHDTVGALRSRPLPVAS